MSAEAISHPGHAHEAAHDHSDHYHNLPFWRKWIFATDHKIIGYQYGISGLAFLLFGFILMLYMRWSIAYPEKEVTGVARWLLDFLGGGGSQRWLAEGKITGDLYNMFGAMHGTIMVFLGIVPVGFAAFGNFVTPLQIGAPDMAFPRINMASYWAFFVGGVLMLVSFFLPSGAAQSGWTNYSPLATVTHMEYTQVFWNGQTQWLVAMVFLITSSLLGAVNFITTILNLRARGLTWMRLPFFVWGMLVTAFLLLLAFPPLEVAALMQLSDRLFGSSFFSSTGMVVNGQLWNSPGGGSPILFQHLFWFLGHPEVYVLLLPGISIVAEVLPCNSRKPLWGYNSMVYAVLVLGFLSFLVWAHHMYMTGMGNTISTFFQTTTVIISIPSVILLTCMIISLWGGSMRFTVPMLFAVAFLPMFGIGGLTGLPLAFSLVDLHLHDTYYVIGHFHYVVAPGVLFGLFAGIYHWYPKATGRMMGTFLGHLHFWPSLLFMNCVFAPMFLQGMHGFHRRWYNGGTAYEEIALDSLGEPWRTFFSWFDCHNYLDLNKFMTWSAYGLAISQLPFIINFFLSLFAGRRVTSDNPWHATTIEWATPTPPGHGNFTSEVCAYRGPYEYSVPGADKDYTPQWERLPGQPEPILKPVDESHAH
ncbi:MAG: cytochrome c oxidase subunit I [Verrucomicrobiales bacterium]